MELLKQTTSRIYELSKTAAGSKILFATAVSVDRATADLISQSSKLERSMSNILSEDQSRVEESHFRVLFPILFGLYEIVMTGDLEVRTRGLAYLFDTIKLSGGTFSPDSWEVVAKGILFPIFDDLKLTRQEHTKFANKEDFSVWLSTTLIQALRLFVDLFSAFYSSLMLFIPGLFELLVVCMTQGM
jgi:brefeldin A-inhibited guanine nucleotide-exchange protein